MSHTISATELYNVVAQQTAQNVTLRYSSSFGMASRLFSNKIRADIYNIYGLVRLADEIVDTYRGNDAEAILEALEQETYRAIKIGYSSNLIVHAFQLTASRYEITADLIRPFFASMTMDLYVLDHTRATFTQYIYGSAEVVGLMCLKVFTDNDTILYKSLEPGARALGSAYQKVNLLRDLALDSIALGRNYFPELQGTVLSEKVKVKIIADIDRDFVVADKYISQLPISSKAAVRTSYYYYNELLKTLRHTPAVDITKRRVRVTTVRKIFLLSLAIIRQRY